MSSRRLIIVARNDATGRIKLPLGSLTLYGTGGEEELLRKAAASFGAGWTLAIYEPIGHTITGGTKGASDAKR